MVLLGSAIPASLREVFSLQIKIKRPTQIAVQAVGEGAGFGFDAGLANEPVAEQVERIVELDDPLIHRGQRSDRAVGVGLGGDRAAGGAGQSGRQGAELSSGTAVTMKASADRQHRVGPVPIDLTLDYAVAKSVKE